MISGFPGVVGTSGTERERIRNWPGRLQSRAIVTAGPGGSRRLFNIQDSNEGQLLHLTTENEA